MPKSLQDIIKGLGNAVDEDIYISQALSGIHSECKSKKVSDKVNAIQKLAFFYLLGVDVKPFAFNAIECMSSTDVSTKRSGYFVSNFSFGSPDMQTLSTNLYVNDIRNVDSNVKMMALSSLASCPSPNREQIHTLLPVLFEQLQQGGRIEENITLLIKLIATTLRLLVLARRQEIEGTADFVPIFVDILFNLASSGHLTNDVVLTQVYAHCSIELAKNFGCEVVMRLIPSLYDILITAIQPWILIETCRFFGFMSMHDARIKAKVRQQFTMLLTNTESKSLVMELSKTIAESFYDDTEMVFLSAKRLSAFIIPSQTKTDANLKILAIKNLAILEDAYNGLIMKTEGLANEIIKMLDDKDFNQRVVVLDVISSLANQQFIENIVSKLLVSLKQTKQMSKGESLKELHQISSSDIQTYKKRVVQVILDMCCRNNYQNITNTSWFISVLITLCMEYPNISADDCAVRLFDLALKSDQLRQDAPKLVAIILQNKQFLDMASLSPFDRGVCLANTSLVGPIVDQVKVSLQQEVTAFNKMLACKYGTAQAQTSEIVEHISQLAGQLPERSNIIQWFAERFYKIMDDNLQVQCKPVRVDRLVVQANARLVQEDELRQALSVNNLLQISAYILGTFFCYQPAGEDAINLYNALQILLDRGIKSMAADTVLVYAVSAFKAFVGLLYSYKVNGLFESNEVVRSCIADGYFGDFTVTHRLTPEQVEAEKKRLVAERDQRNQGVDFTFMSDAERESCTKTPVVEEVCVAGLDSLVNMFVTAYDLLVSRIREFSLVPGMVQQCNVLYHLAGAVCDDVAALLAKVENAELRGRLEGVLAKYVAQFGSSEDPEASAAEGAIPTLEALGQAVLDVRTEDNFIQQRCLERPEFAFEHGGIFSLDNEDGRILSQYDMYEYVFEEGKTDTAQLQRGRHKAGVQGASPAKADTFFNGRADAQTEEAHEVNAGAAAANEMEDIFGKPTGRNAFIISKLSKAEPRIELNKYTQGLRIGSARAVADPQAAPRAEEHRRRKKRHSQRYTGDAQQVEYANAKDIDDQVVNEAINAAAELAVEGDADGVEGAHEAAQEGQQAEEKPPQDGGDDIINLFT